MRRTIVFGLFALLTVGAAHDACAQRRGGAGFGSARGGHGFSRARFVSPYGFLPYDFDSGYSYASQPALFIQQAPLFVQPPEPPAAAPPVNPVVTEYKWPAAAAASSPSASPAASESGQETFAIVLKDGSTISALMVFASDDGLHYVDPDERHLRVSISEIDRAATLKLNRARNLNLHLPAAQ